MPITFSFKALLSGVIGIASTAAAIFFWNDSDNKASTPSINNVLNYNNDSSYALTTNTNSTILDIDVDNHHLLLKGNWIIMISTDWTPSQGKHLQWWKDSQLEYNSTKSTGTVSLNKIEPQSSDGDTLRFAYVDGETSPELVALLQVRGYPSIRLVTDDGTHLRTFNRALLLAPTTFVHHLENWKSNLAVWSEFGGVNGWGRLYAGQVRVFNGVWGRLQCWQVELIKSIRERRGVVTGTLVGGAMGVSALYRFGYLPAMA
jgi:hypothetical protein